MVFAAAGAGCFVEQCFAQQPTTNANDPYNPQTQRNFNNNSMPTNPPLNSAYPGAPNNVEPSLISLGTGTDQGNIGPFVTPADKQFAGMTAMRSMMELKLSQAAAERASGEGVRQLAHRMVDDYTKWSDGLTHVSERLSIQVPTELDAKHQAEVDRVLALSGTAFDDAYLKIMVHLQNKALTITHYEAENAGVARLRTWAGVMIPTIQEELKLAKQAQNSSALVSRK